jgi:5-methylcytosine-specific restriction endonuclease McrA
VTRKQRYYRYLESDHWRRLRHLAFQRDGYRCTVCGRTNNLRGHHKRYHEVLEHCTVDDIQTMCQPCHDAHHRRVAKARRRDRKNRRPRLDRLVFVLLNFDAEL